MELTDKQIKIAVDWWFNAIQSPTSDNGCPDQTALAMLLREATPPPDGDAFKSRLAELLRENNPSGLFVDYYPEGVLALISDEMNVVEWPWKTRMFFRENGSVEVSEGYGKPLVDLTADSVAQSE